MSKSDTGDLLEELKKFIEGKDQQNLIKSLDDLQEKLNDLMVCVKYNLFDLEATHRENDQLKQQIRELNEE